MPTFRVRVLIQCAPPGVTPDVPYVAVTMPNRMLWELPRELAPLLAGAGTYEVAAAGTVAGAALAAARKLFPAGHAWDVLPEPYNHREVAGTYVRSSGSETLAFIVCARGSSRPLTQRYTIEVPMDGGAGGGTVDLAVEFRCHVMVELAEKQALDASET